MVNDACRPPLRRGNAALETANHIYGDTARVNLVSPTRVKVRTRTPRTDKNAVRGTGCGADRVSAAPVKLSWETHYVGHVRGVNNEVMDSYMLKSMDIIGGSCRRGPSCHSAQNFPVHAGMLQTPEDGARRDGSSALVQAFTTPRTCASPAKASTTDGST